MAQRPTNPSPYMTRVDATKDISFQFLIAEIDIFTEVHIIIRSNVLSGDSFPEIARLDLKDGSLTYSTDGGVTSHVVDGQYPTEIYGNDSMDSVVELTLPAGVLENGNAYKWQIDGIGDTREFYFETAPTPIVKILTNDDVVIDNDGRGSLLSARTVFDGDVYVINTTTDDGGVTASEEVRVDIDYYRWEVRNITDGGVLEKTTDNRYGANMKFEYNRFIGGQIYSVTLFVKPTMWDTEHAHTIELSIDYLLADGGDEIDVAVDSSRNRILVDFSKMSVDAEISGYDVLRTDKTSSKPVYIARLSESENRIYDYSARATDACSYTVYPIVSDQYLTPMSTTSVVPTYDSWTLMSVKRVGDGVYTKGEFEWNFYVDVAPEDYTHNMGVSMQETNSRYPSVRKKQRNFVTGGLTVSSGYIKCNGKYAENEFVFMLWEKFLQTKDAKIITDPFGHKYIVEVTDSSHNTEAFNQTKTTIKFSFTEIADASDVSVFDVFDPKEEEMLDVSGLSATYGNEKVYLRWSDPANTVLGNITTVQWEATQVVYSADGYPEVPEDGTVAGYITERDKHRSNALTITGLENGRTYYFSFFTYSTDGVMYASDAGRVSVTPNRIPIARIPKQEGEVVYSGSSQSATFAYYYPSMMTIGGQTYATNAGVYNVEFTPTADYCWDDGTFDAKLVEWTIAKECGSIVLENYSALTDSDDGSVTAVASIVGDGSIQVVCTDPDVSISIDGLNANVTVTGGTSRIIDLSMSVVEDGNHDSKHVATFELHYILNGDTLENVDWSTISMASRAGLAEKYWSVGDEKCVVDPSSKYYGENSYIARIIGFNHDLVADPDAYGNQRAGITFERSSNSISFGSWNNADDVTGVDWSSSSIRSTVERKCLGSSDGYFSKSLQSSIVEVRKPYACAIRDGDISYADMQYSNDKVFILSLSEIIGEIQSFNVRCSDKEGFTYTWEFGDVSTAKGCLYEGDQYAYYRDLPSSSSPFENDRFHATSHATATRTLYNRSGKGYFQEFEDVPVSSFAEENAERRAFKVTDTVYVKYAFCV